MTSKLVVNNIEADAGVSTVTFGSEISASTFTGNLTGNVTGNLTGNVTGNVTSSSTSTFSSGLNVTGGSVGIGTDNPQRKLSIKDSGNTFISIENSTNVTSGLIGANSSGLTLISRDTQGGSTEKPIQFITGSTEKVRIDSSGNVGIGTDDPDSGLEITGSTTSFDALKLNSTSTSNGAGAFINFEVDGTVRNSIKGYIDGANLGGNLIFYTADGSASLNEAARFNPSGNLVFPSGQGIDFSATADGGNGSTTSSEVLDDYEEGTWDPTWTGNGASIGSGTYTKIGRLVTLHASITFPSTANTATQVLGGLPFNAAGSGAFAGYSIETGNATYPGFVFRYSGTQYYTVRSASAQNTDLTRAQTSGISAKICLQYTI